MYNWRKLNQDQKQQVLEHRKKRGLPWHRPPHFDFDGAFTFIITAACFNHLEIIGKTKGRLERFEEALLSNCREVSESILAWCILPNHYHLLIHTDRIKELRKVLGTLHGRTSRQWNLEDDTVGRKIWYNYFDREMKSTGHYWASLNYIHNNVVHHGYVEKWQEWPYSSVHEYLFEIGRDQAARIWREYPVLEYGKDWDVY